MLWWLGGRRGSCCGGVGVEWGNEAGVCGYLEVFCLHSYGSGPWRHFGYLLSWFVVMFCLSFEVLAA